MNSEPPRIDDAFEKSGWWSVEWSVVHIATHLPQVDEIDHIAVKNVINLAHERAKRQQRRQA